MGESKGIFERFVLKKVYTVQGLAGGIKFLHFHIC